MHKWTVYENIICILCYKLYKNLPVNKQKDILQAFLPDISRSSISMKLANIKYLDIPGTGFKNGSKVLKQQWELLKSS